LVIFWSLHIFDFVLLYTYGINCGIAVLFGGSMKYQVIQLPDNRRALSLTYKGNRVNLVIDGTPQFLAGKTQFEVLNKAICPSTIPMSIKGLFAEAYAFTHKKGRQHPPHIGHIDFTRLMPELSKEAA